MNLEDHIVTEIEDLINEKVTHIKFGTGVIKANKNKIIQIQFDDLLKEKKFIYPDAFEKFLRFQDPVLNEKVQCEIKKINDKIAMQTEKDRTEAERREKEWEANIERVKMENKSKKGNVKNNK